MYKASLEETPSATKKPLLKPFSILVWMIVKKTGPIKNARTMPETIPLRMIAIRTGFEKRLPFFKLLFLQHPWKFILSANLTLSLHPVVKCIHGQHINVYIL